MIDKNMMTKIKDELTKLNIPFEENEDETLIIPRYEWMSNFMGAYSEDGHYTLGISKGGRWRSDTFHDIYTLGEAISEIARFYFEEREENTP